MVRNQFSWPVQIYYEDTDSGGVVYHSNYLNFMERARTEWLRSLKINQQILKKELNLLFVVHQINIKFIKPAIFNDLIDVETALKQLTSVRVKLEQHIKRNHDLLITASVVIVGVNARTFKPVRIPEQIKSLMECK
ncbi:MAG: tol-pal system-associated acyl-CoA thioesterase [Proteobacteria bacterium]|jgi:acyl-CoA thioester hydrolase|nr:tol-pal system-associated acyl-CoA thioesterase [Pseudomonadota bacterium]MDA0941368.1 tol-pal system-associated acyl-CoA thioesterase [Pseudomonadota bacterium]MDA1034488.1 tol-pal system-associated acyl-CoA thioesterase [Pseudomonadota bacterium]